MTTSLRLSNYYGTVEVKKLNDKYYIQLHDWSGKDMEEISKELYNLLIKELG